MEKLDFEVQINAPAATVWKTMLDPESYKVWVKAFSDQSQYEGTWEQWNEDGARTATERATDIWQRALEEFEQPALGPGVAEELEAYVARRKEQIGDGDP